MAGSIVTRQLRALAAGGLNLQMPHRFPSMDDIMEAYELALEKDIGPLRDVSLKAAGGVEANAQPDYLKLDVSVTALMDTLRQSYFRCSTRTSKIQNDALT